MDEKKSFIQQVVDEDIFIGEKWWDDLRKEIVNLLSRIKELEESNEGLRDALNLRKKALVQATNGIKQLNEHMKELVDGIEIAIHLLRDTGMTNDGKEKLEMIKKLIEKEER